MLRKNSRRFFCFQFLLYSINDGKDVDLKCKMFINELSISIRDNILITLLLCLPQKKVETKRDTSSKKS